MARSTQIPKTTRGIRARIQAYEKRLRAEKKRFGAIDDSAGKRYLLGPMYLMVGDVEGSVKSFAWFDKTFPDDGGEPGHRLSWALALFRSGDLDGAKRRLRQAMLSNVYLIPRLLDEAVPRIEGWFGSNLEAPEYLDVLPDEFFAVWDDGAKRWASKTYHADEVQRVLGRHIEIHRELVDLAPGPERSRLVNEAWELWGNAD